MRRRSQSGVTLMELLIAITLLSVITVGIMFAMRIGLNALERSNSRFIANRRVMGVDRVMHEQLAGIMPVKAKCMAGVGEPPAEVPFFQGEPGSMRFASSYSLEEGARGYPHILEYLVIPGEEGRGVRLVMNEYIYTGPISAGATCAGGIGGVDGLIGRYRPVEIGPKAFVLADKLSRCSFAYKEEVDHPPFEIWQPEWRSIKLPVAVRIDLAPLEPEGANLEVLPVTVRLQLTRNPNVKYAN
jgi:prepilin-type N-terminal cleavage/methylation domain-containing protein